LKASLHLDDDQLVIYTDKLSAYLGQGLLSFAIIVVGALIIDLAHGERFLYIFGGFWIFCGLLFSTNLIYIYRNMRNQEVAVLLSVSHSSVTIAPHFQLPKTTCTWSDISKIVLAKRLIVGGDSDTTQYFWHQAIIYFQTDKKMGLLQRNKLGIEKSAEGCLFVNVKYPKDKANIVIAALQQFSEGRVEISLVNRVDINEPGVLALLT